MKNSSRNMANHSEPIAGPAASYGVRPVELYEDISRTFSEVRSQKTLRDECGEPAGLGEVALSGDYTEKIEIRTMARKVVKRKRWCVMIGVILKPWLAPRGGIVKGGRNTRRDPRKRCAESHQPCTFTR